MTSKGVLVRRRVEKVGVDYTVNMLAVTGGIGTGRLANANAVFTDAHEVGPFMDLLHMCEHGECERERSSAHLPETVGTV